MNQAKLYKTVSSNESIDAIINRHTELVKRIAYHLSNRLPSSIQTNDLIQAGMIGLIEAAKKYDPSKGASFETFSGIRIRGAMLDEVRNNDWVPRFVYKNMRQISNATHKIENENGRRAKPSEIAEELGVSLKEYNAILRDTYTVEVFSIEDGNTIHVVNELTDGTSPPEKIQKDVFKGKLAKLISELPRQECLVLAFYYDEGLNFKEIGKVINVSEARISQIHSQAISRLQTKVTKANLQRRE